VHTEYLAKAICKSNSASARWPKHRKRVSRWRFM